jgi:hypothetical protein
MASISAEHLQLLRAKLKDSPLWKHCLQEHHGDKGSCDFVMELISRFRDPLTRLIYERVLIKWAAKESLINSRSEWSQPKVARFLLVRNMGDPEPSRDPQPTTPSRTQGPRIHSEGPQTPRAIAPILQDQDQVQAPPKRGRPPKARPLTQEIPGPQTTQPPRFPVVLLPRGRP